MPRRRGAPVRPPWHPRVLLPALFFGLPAVYLFKIYAPHIPSHWRNVKSSPSMNRSPLIISYRQIPSKLPHLVLLWIQQLVTWLADTYSFATLVVVWLALIGLIFLLPSATRPDFEQRRLQRQIASLEKEVKELAEDLHAIDPKVRGKVQAEMDSKKAR